MAVETIGQYFTLLKSWCPDLSWAQAHLDMIRLIHLGGVALGLGTVIFVAMSVHQMMVNGPDDRFLSILHRAHRQIVLAICVLWASGIVLIGIRTNFDPGAFSPKLLAKLVTVTILTIDAVMMGRFVSPLIDKYEGRPLADMAMPEKLLVANCAALSGASWLYALMLGASSVLKTAQMPMLLALGGVIYGSAYVLTTSFSVFLHRTRAA
ncbi:hypothetical protein JM93_04191 [Roseibium hamelinense]|uniref:Uncharacterized protein n=1 Tax=Roseibium hamelinense TaxID=150831 RepID=A0A562SFM4_9HYPH|nr:hypothetical protein [Roseibium hamelinense]MTI44140.1 hypothetical protein [Roseibium hamelinense]TWI80078.1 hypothetical protein JM93_04191 [Roseibium hamelinense]